MIPAYLPPYREDSRVLHQRQIGSEKPPKPLVNPVAIEPRATSASLGSRVKQLHPNDAIPKRRLREAASIGGLSVLDWMIKNGSLDKLDDQTILTVISIAGKNNQTEFLYRLFLSSRFDETHSYLGLLENALIDAAEENYPATIDALIRSSRFEDIEKDSISEALCEAIQIGHPDVVEALILSDWFQKISDEEALEVLDLADRCSRGSLKPSSYNTIIDLLLRSGKFGPINLKKPLEALKDAFESEKTFLIVPLLQSGHLNYLFPDELPESPSPHPLMDLIIDNIRKTKLLQFNQPSPERLGESLLEAVQSNNVPLVTALTRSTDFVKIDPESYMKALLMASSRKKDDPCFLLLKNSEPYNELDEAFKYPFL